MLAVIEPPQSTTAWSSGSTGERKVEASLSKPVKLGKVIALHDRRVPRSRGNIDHIVVGPAGVYVVDTKRYVGSKVERRSSGTFFRSEPDRLFVGGRDRSKLVAGMEWQVSTVQKALSGMSHTPAPKVMPVLCFVDAEWDLFSGPYDIEGTHVTDRRGLVRHVTRPGPLGEAERGAIAGHLAEKLPEA